MAYWDSPIGSSERTEEWELSQRSGCTSRNSVHFFSSLHCGPNTRDNLVPVLVYLDCILSNLHWCSVNRMWCRCGSIPHCSIYADSKSTFRPRCISSFTALIKGAICFIFLCFCIESPHEGGIVPFHLFLNFWFHCISGFNFCVCVRVLCLVFIVYKGPAFNNKRQQESNHLNTVSTW